MEPAIPTLFHVSEEPGIQRFKPRPAPSPDSGVKGLAVFAIEDRLLHNYLLPRDCPRGTFYADSRTSPDDRRRFMGCTAARHVVAIESRWLKQIAQTTLYCYELPPATFRCIDESAGYYASDSCVVPKSVRVVDDILAALLERDVELRVVRTLWPLHDAVAESTLCFSMIRMRNAQMRV
ncbi:MAG TPA: hypothetical protein VH370_19065, partial [Humisphaera sp.]|nr:hypothetical protein [Humisphaera sp.]